MLFSHSAGILRLPCGKSSADKWDIDFYFSRQHHFQLSPIIYTSKIFNSKTHYVNGLFSENHFTCSYPNREIIGMTISIIVPCFSIDITRSLCKESN